MHRAVYTPCRKRTGLCGSSLLHAEDVVLRLRYERIDIAALRHEIHACERIAAARRGDKHMRCAVRTQGIRHARRIAHRRRQLGRRRDCPLLRRQRGEELLCGLVPDAVRLCQRPAKETAHDAARLRRKCALDVCKVRAREDVKAGEIDHDRARTGQTCGIPHRLPNRFLRRSEHIILCPHGGIAESPERADLQGAPIEGTKADERARCSDDEIAPRPQPVEARVKVANFLSGNRLHRHPPHHKAVPPRPDVRSPPRGFRGRDSLRDCAIYSGEPRSMT